MKIVCPSEAAILDIVSAWYVSAHPTWVGGGSTVYEMFNQVEGSEVHFIRSLTAVMSSWTHQFVTNDQYCICHHASNWRLLLLRHC